MHLWARVYWPLPCAAFASCALLQPRCRWRLSCLRLCSAPLQLGMFGAGGAASSQEAARRAHVSHLRAGRAAQQPAARHAEEARCRGCAAARRPSSRAARLMRRGRAARAAVRWPLLCSMRLSRPQVAGRERCRLAAHPSTLAHWQRVRARVPGSHLAATAACRSVPPSASGRRGCACHTCSAWGPGSCTSKTRRLPGLTWEPRPATAGPAAHVTPDVWRLVARHLEPRAWARACGAARSLYAARVRIARARPSTTECPSEWAVEQWPAAHSLFLDLRAVAAPPRLPQAAGAADGGAGAAGPARPALLRQRWALPALCCLHLIYGVSSDERAAGGLRRGRGKASPTPASAFITAGGGRRRMRRPRRPRCWATWRCRRCARSARI